MNIRKIKFNLGKITDMGIFVKFIDDSYVGLISNNKIIKVFNIYSGECTKTFKESDSEIEFFELSMDSFYDVSFDRTLITSEYFYSGQGANKISLWNVDQGKVYKSKKSECFGYSTVTNIVSNNLENIVISYTGKTILLSKWLNINLYLNINWTCSLDVDKDSKRLVTGDHDGYLKISDLKTGNIIREKRIFELSYCEPSEFQYLKCYFNLYNDNEVFVTVQTQKKVFIYSIDEDKLLESKMIHNEFILLSIISHDKSKLITMSFNKEKVINNENNNYNDYSGYFNIKIWCLKNKTVESEINIASSMRYLDDFYNEFDIKSISINYDNTKLAILSEKDGLLIYNISSGVKINSISQKIEKIHYPIYFSREKGILTYTSNMNIIDIFSINKNRIIKRLNINNVHSFNKNKALVELNPGKLSIIDLETGNEIDSFIIDDNIIFKSFINGDFIIIISINQKVYSHNYSVKTNLKILCLETREIINELDFDFYLEDIKILDNEGKFALFYINHLSVGVDTDFMFAKSISKSIMLFDFVSKSFTFDLEWLENDKNIKISNNPEIRLFSTNNHVLLIGNSSKKGKINYKKDEIIFWNYLTHEIDKKVITSINSKNYIFDENNEILIIKGGVKDSKQFIEIWETKNDIKLIKTIKIDKPNYYDYYLLKDENIILFLDRDGGIKFFDINKMNELAIFYMLENDESIIIHKEKNITYTNKPELFSIENLYSYKSIEDNELKSKFLVKMSNDKIMNKIFSSN